MWKLLSKLFREGKGDYRKDYNSREVSKEEMEQVNARILADIRASDFPQGFTWVPKGKSQLYYYRCGESVMVIYTEICGTENYDLLIYSDFDHWTYPSKAMLSEVETSELKAKFKAYLKTKGIENTLPSIA